MKRLGVLAGLLAACSITSTYAQTTDCSTYDWGAGMINRYQTTCTTSPGASSYISAYSDLASLYLQAYELQYEQQLLDQYQAQQARQAIQAVLNVYASYGLYPGSFLRFNEAAAIYRLGNDGFLHVFQTWQQFLNYGGHANLDNVSAYRINGSVPVGLLGAPVP